MKVERLAVLWAALFAALEIAAVWSMWGAFPLASTSIMGPLVALVAGILAFSCAYLGLSHVQHRIRQEKSVGTRAEAHARKQVERLEALRRVDLAINTNADLRFVFPLFLREVASQLKVDAATILVLNPKTQVLECVAAHGFRYSGIVRASQRVDEGLAGRAVLQRTLVHQPDLAAEPGIALGKLLQGEDFVSYFGVPLVAKGHVHGVLEVLHRGRYVADVSWLGFLEAMAAQAAIAIENASMLTELKRSHFELKVAYDSTLEGWVKALDLRDKETEGHTQRVTEMTVRLAREMGIEDDQIEHIRRGALLHDVGKIGIPDEILLKPGRLTDEEWTVMRRHPVYAYEWLSPVAYLRPALDIPYAHHERWDGGGYPRGLKGTEIPLAARIFAVVDVWDALRSDRPYREGWPLEQVRDYLLENAGTQFDPQVVKVFLSQVLCSEEQEAYAV